MTPAEGVVHDAIIVGAGITGLALATHLAAAGYDSLILEARDRVGGRLLSVPTADGTHSVDLGASWFWPDELRVQALAAAEGLPLHAQHLAGDALFQSADGVQRLRGNPLDGPAQRFCDGAQSLPLALAAPLAASIALATPVTAIGIVEEAGRSLVAVEHRGGTARARVAVVAVPPALAVADIAFDPPLPAAIAQLAARTPVWMGGMTKAVAEYATPFWRREGLAGAAISHTGPLRELHDLSGPDGQCAALFGFAAPSPAPLERSAIIAQLVALFGEEARIPQALHLRDWRDERWTAPAHAEQLADYGTYGDPRYGEAIHGRLWLAATETGPDHAGHIEGALAAAEQVAAAVCAVLRTAT